ncbi:unnamed protein product [Vitrella brassicaformis CCMP3155]|uniref:Uncharacterized protein n=2 Tax=Vitrella brassicaformis TaxID=1169539 RepID=A0A0G4ENN2_VITBC|nr:unnamed protein product [Vitrella brassicaformis CCMP3155]|eukprot:CEL98562.1 unnamed protein product [Vitrella brassicaformis CCMP3155]
MRGRLRDADVPRGYAAKLQAQRSPRSTRPTPSTTATSSHRNTQHAATQLPKKDLRTHYTHHRHRPPLPQAPPPALNAVPAAASLEESPLAKPVSLRLTNGPLSLTTSTSRRPAAREPVQSQAPSLSRPPSAPSSSHRESPLTAHRNRAVPTPSNASPQLSAARYVPNAHAGRDRHLFAKFEDPKDSEDATPPRFREGHLLSPRVPGHGQTPAAGAREETDIHVPCPSSLPPPPPPPPPPHFTAKLLPSPSCSSHRRARDAFDNADGPRRYLSESAAVLRVQRWWRHRRRVVFMRWRLRQMCTLVRLVRRLQRWWRRMRWIGELTRRCEERREVVGKFGRRGTAEGHHHPLPLPPPEEQIIPTVARRLGLLPAADGSLIPEHEHEHSTPPHPNNNNNNNNKTASPPSTWTAGSEKSLVSTSQHLPPGVGCEGLTADPSLMHLHATRRADIAGPNPTIPEGDERDQQEDAIHEHEEDEHEEAKCAHSPMTVMSVPSSASASGGTKPFLRRKSKAVPAQTVDWSGVGPRVEPWLSRQGKAPTTRRRHAVAEDGTLSRGEDDSSFLAASERERESVPMLVRTGAGGAPCSRQPPNTTIGTTTSRRRVQGSRYPSAPAVLSESFSRIRASLQGDFAASPSPGHREHRDVAVARGGGGARDDQSGDVLCDSSEFERLLEGIQRRGMALPVGLTAEPIDPAIAQLERDLDALELSLHDAGILSETPPVTGSSIPQVARDSPYIASLQLPEDYQREVAALVREYDRLCAGDVS